MTVVLDEEVLEHYGVKGMRWGKRKSESSSSGETRRFSGGRKKEPPPGVTQVPKTRKIRGGVKKKDLKNMTDKDLQDALRRMNMEQQYKNMVSNTPSKNTRSFIFKVGKTAVFSAATGILTKKLTEAMTKAI